MNKKTWTGLALVALTGLALAGLALSPFADKEVQAADHTDPPPRATGPTDSGDIGDLYAWHTGTGANQRLNVVLTFGGPALPEADQSGLYDEDTLYGIHIDNTGDHVADLTVYARYGKNINDEWGVQVIGLPGEAGPVIGPVEQELTGTSGRVWTGLRDDPFFFDLDGFVDTLNTQTLMFDSTNDSFAGANITALVLEMPMAAAQGAGSSINVWATTAKK